MSAPRSLGYTLLDLAEKQVWSKKKLLGISEPLLLDIAIVSAALGLAIAIIGVYASTLISHLLSLIIGAIMLGVGLIIGYKSFILRQEN